MFGTATAWPSLGARMELVLLDELSRCPAVQPARNGRQPAPLLPRLILRLQTNGSEESGKFIMYGHIGVTGTLAGASFATAYQGGGALGFTMFGLAMALTALTLLFAVVAILGLLPKPGARS